MANDAALAFEQGALALAQLKGGTHAHIEGIVIGAQNGEARHAEVVQLELMVLQFHGGAVHGEQVAGPEPR